MTVRFSQHMLHSDQFGYAKHARAFRTQIDLIKRINADQFGYGKHGCAFRTHLNKVYGGQKSRLANLGTESTLPFQLVLAESAMQIEISEKSLKAKFIYSSRML